MFMRRECLARAGGWIVSRKPWRSSQRWPCSDASGTFHDHQSHRRSSWRRSSGVQASRLPAGPSTDSKAAMPLRCTDSTMPGMLQTCRLEDSPRSRQEFVVGSTSAVSRPTAPIISRGMVAEHRERSRHHRARSVLDRPVRRARSPTAGSNRQRSSVLEARTAVTLLARRAVLTLLSVKYTCNVIQNGSNASCPSSAR